jgi:hypothetical protein
MHPRKKLDIEGGSLEIYAELKRYSALEGRYFCRLFVP